jgi:hypothetical protein
VPNLMRTHFSPFTHCHLICVRWGCWSRRWVPVMPPKKRDTPFQAHNVDEFGLWICERAIGNSTAVVKKAVSILRGARKGGVRSGNEAWSFGTRQVLQGALS